MRTGPSKKKTKKPVTGEAKKGKKMTKWDDSKLSKKEIEELDRSKEVRASDLLYLSSMEMLTIAVRRLRLMRRKPNSAKSEKLTLGCVLVDHHGLGSQRTDPTAPFEYAGGRGQR